MAISSYSDAQPLCEERKCVTVDGMTFEAKDPGRGLVRKHLHD